MTPCSTLGHSYRPSMIRFLLFCGGMLTMSLLLAQEPRSGNKLLVIHDASDMGVWRQSFDNSLHSYLTQVSEPNQILRMSVEYTGLNLVPEGERPTELIELLRQRQALDPASLVVSVLPSAAEFMVQYGGEIYPGIAKIYFGTELGTVNVDPRGLPDTLMVINTSLAEAAQENFMLIPRLVPDVTDIFVLSGAGVYGQTQRRLMQQIAAQSEIAATVHFTDGLPLEELVEFMARQGGNFAVMALAYENDNQGNSFSTQDVTRILSKSIDAPIFGMFDSIFGEGIVGGYMARASTAGESVGRLAMGYVAGEPIDQPPTSYHYLFDGRQLDRLDIDRSLLPQNATVEFDAFSIWDNYALQIVAAFIVMLIQAIFIMALVVSLRLRRRAERELQQHAQDLSVQKNLFESVINSIPDAVLISRVDRTIYAANKSTKEVFGCDWEALIGVKVTELIHYADDYEREQEQAMLESTAEALEPLILQFRRQDGELFSGETVGTRIISADGEALGYFSLIRDVTRRLSMEQEQQQSQKLEALGTLVGGIAHDFNNVLGVISAYAEILSFDEGQPERQANILKIIKATERGSDLCKQIMSFSRDMSVEQKSINLLAVAKETARLLVATIPSRITLDLDHDGENFPVHANFTQMQQVILNLATNAAHAIADEAGTIKITLSVEVVQQKLFLSQGWVDPGSYAVLRVADNGCGIDQADLNRIFEPFFTTGKNNGTGMGLAMVYKIVKAHKGTIDLQSERGSGTEFCVYIPLQQVAVDLAADATEQAVVQGQGERIMLVDDELELLQSVQRILTGIGYDVDAYSDAVEALDTFRQNPDNYDLLISDQVMPVLNGTHLLESIRELRKDLPVIICTGYSEVLDSGYEHISEISSIMRKPVNAAEMSKSIERALSAGH